MQHLHSAEIGLDHVRIVLNLLWLSFGDLSSKIQNDDSVGSIHDQLHVVFDQENGRAVFRDAAKDFRQTARFIVVEAGGRFVEQQEFGSAAKARATSRRRC